MRCGEASSRAIRATTWGTEDAVYEIIDGQVWVAGKHVLWATEIKCVDLLEHTPMWEWHDRAFHVPLENGLVVSTIWGTATHTVNHFRWGREDQPFQPASPDAEMACWWANRRDDEGMLRWGADGDTVIDHVPATIWWELIGRLGRVPTGTPLPEGLVAFAWRRESG